MKDRVVIDANRLFSELIAGRQRFRAVLASQP